MAERYEYRVRYRTPDWCVPTSFPAHSEAAARKQADDFRSLLVGDVWIEVRAIGDWESLGASGPGMSQPPIEGRR